MFGFRRTLAQTGARACLAAGLVVAMLAISGIGAGSAMAAECIHSEVNIMGQGDSLQRAAQELWTGRVVKTKLPVTKELPNEATSGGYAKACPSGGGDDTVSYASTSTVAALEAFGFLGEGKIEHETSYIGTDYAPTAAQIEHAEKGSGGARPVVIPVAQTAIAVVAHLPTGCTIVAGITWKDLNKLFAGTITHWSELATDNGNAACSGTIERVVRTEGAGETYHFKNYLSALETGQSAEAPGCNTQTGHSNWAELRPIETGGSPNTIWPECTGRSTVHRAAGSGALAEYVKSTAGTIGYVSLPDARAKSAATVPLQNGVEITEPTYGTPEEGETGKPTGKANCGGRSYSVPSGAREGVTTTSEGVDWSQTFGASATVGGGFYPLCALTFDIGWNSYELAGYGEGSAGKLQSILHAFFSYVLGEGQSLLNSKYYSELPHPAGKESEASNIAAAAGLAKKMIVTGFTSEGLNTTVSGFAGTSHVFTNKGANVTCTEVSPSGEIPSPIPTLKLKQSYAGCKSGTKTVDAETSGEFRFRDGEWETATTSIEFKVTEPAGVTICTITIPGQWLIGMTYENTGAEIKMTTATTNIEYTTTGTGCAQQGTFTEGEYTGVEKLSGNKGAVMW